MQLFVNITTHEEMVPEIMKKMMNAGFQGASVIDCEGMLSAVGQQPNATDVPMFGSLRNFLNPEGQMNKMIICVMPDEKVQVAKEIIHEVAGSLKLPATGIMFTLPVMNWEGVSHK